MFSTAATSPADVPLPVKRRMLAGFGSYRQAVARRHPATALPDIRTIPNLELAYCNRNVSWLDMAVRNNLQGEPRRYDRSLDDGAQRTIHHNAPFVSIALLTLPAGCATFSPGLKRRGSNDKCHRILARDVGNSHSRRRDRYISGGRGRADV